MVTEYIRYKIGDDRQAEFEDAYGRAQEALLASPNCLGYELSRCVEDATYYTLRIEWDSLEGHLQGFRRSPEFRAFFGHIRHYVDDIEEMRHYEPTSVRGKQN
jgi:quinol monooxygenase YgiN